jgi:hypothetical protein
MRTAMYDENESENNNVLPFTTGTTRLKWLFQRSYLAS